MKQKVRKNKISGSDLVTRAILKQELKKELRRFATKDDLSNFKLDVLAEINRSELKTIDREQDYHSEVMTQFDKIMKKLETMRQEDTIDDFQRDEKIENHEKRIKILESSQKS